MGADESLSAGARLQAQDEQQSPFLGTQDSCQHAGPQWGRGEAETL